MKPISTAGGASSRWPLCRSPAPPSPEVAAGRTTQYLNILDFPRETAGDEEASAAFDEAAIERRILELRALGEIKYAVARASAG